MCQFGDSSKVISELNLLRDEALIGFRNCYINNPFNNKEKFLKSINIDFIWKKKEIIVGNPTLNNSEGIYNYNHYYNNHYNNNNNYNDNNYYYNDYNYYYNNNHYKITMKTKLWGKVFSYKEGFRSQYCIPTHLVILDKDSKWFEDRRTVEFANHFNSAVEELAKDYDCEVLEYKDYKKG